MADSHDTAASEAQNLDAAATDSSAQEVTTDQNEDVEPVDLALAKAEVDDAQTRAGLEARVTRHDRALGHIPEHARRLDRLEQALVEQRTSQDDGQAARWNSLLTALGDYLPPEAMAQLRIDTGAQESNGRIAALEAEIERLKNPPAPEAPDEMTPEVQAIVRGWDRAQQIIMGVMEQRGLEASDIPQEDWAKVFNEDPSSPSDGMAKMLAIVEERAATKRRRGERQDAAAGGDTGSSTRRGGLTFEQMKEMSSEQLMQYPREERDAALLRGPARA